MHVEFDFMRDFPDGKRMVRFYNYTTKQTMGYTYPFDNRTDSEVCKDAHERFFCDTGVRVELPKSGQFKFKD